MSSQVKPIWKLQSWMEDLLLAHLGCVCLRACLGRESAPETWEVWLVQVFFFPKMFRKSLDFIFYSISLFYLSILLLWLQRTSYFHNYCNYSVGWTGCTIFTMDMKIKSIVVYFWCNQRLLEQTLEPRPSVSLHKMQLSVHHTLLYHQSEFAYHAKIHYLINAHTSKYSQRHLIYNYTSQAAARYSVSSWFSYLFKCISEAKTNKSLSSIINFPKVIRGENAQTHVETWISLLQICGRVSSLSDTGQIHEDSCSTRGGIW